MKYSELYDEKSTISLSTSETISLTDTFPNLFKVNEPIDTSIVYTTCKDNSLRNATIDIDVGANNGVTFVYDTIKLNNGRYINKIEYAPIYQNEQFKPQYVLVNKYIPFWNGVNFDKTEVNGKNSQSKFVRNMKTNNMLFRVSLKGCYKTDISENYSNTPNIIDINLLDLINNPELYYITNISMPNPYVFYTVNGEYNNTTQDIKICLLNSTDTSTGITDIVNCIRMDPFNSSAPREVSFLSNNSGQKGNFLGGGDNEILYNMTKYYSVDTIPEFEMDFPNFNIDEINETTTIDYGIKKIAECANSIFCQDSIIYFNYNANNTPTTTVSRTHMRLYRLLKGEFVVKLLAGAGLYFIPADTILNNDVTPDNLGNYDFVCLGEMDTDGYTTGRFIVGNDINKYTGYNKNGNIQNESFNPDKSSSGDDIDEIGINDFPINDIGGLARYYAIDRFQLDELQADFKNSTTGIPLDAGQFVIGLYQLPLDIPSFCTTSQEKIVLGKLETNAVGKKLLTVNRRVHLGEYFISDNCGNNFLDYAPYTEIKLYIPFCGMVELPPNLFINSTVSVDMIIDIISGSCKGMVMCNNTFYTSISGSLMCSLPLSLEQCATKSLSIINSANSIMSGIIFGNKNYSALNTVTTLGEAMIENNNIAPSHISGNMDSVVNFYDPQFCILFMTYPEVNMGDIGKTHGKVCNYQDTLNNCHGYTVVNNPHLEIKCTNTEKDEITKLLEQGVILP